MQAKIASLARCENASLSRLRQLPEILFWVVLEFSHAGLAAQFDFLIAVIQGHRSAHRTEAVIGDDACRERVGFRIGWFGNGL